MSVSVKGSLCWHGFKFLSVEQPNWLFWECAYHLWGPLVEIAKLTGVRTIFHAACDLDVQPVTLWSIVLVGGRCTLGGFRRPIGFLYSTGTTFRAIAALEVQGADSPESVRSETIGELTSVKSHFSAKITSPGWGR